MANLAYKKKPIEHLSKLLDDMETLCSEKLLQELGAQEEALLEDLLQSIKHQEGFFEGFSPEAQIAQIEQLTDRLEKELEEYLHG